MQLLSERTSFVIVDLVAICLLLYMSSRSCVVPRSIPSHILTCVIFTRSLTSHVMYHVISPDAWLPTPTFPVWFTNTLTKLGWLPNWITCTLSYLGNTPVGNSRTWMTERHGDLTVTYLGDWSRFKAPGRSRNGREGLNSNEGTWNWKWLLEEELASTWKWAVQCCLQGRGDPDSRCIITWHQIIHQVTRQLHLQMQRNFFCFRLSLFHNAGINRMI